MMGYNNNVVDFEDDDDDDEEEEDEEDEEVEARRMTAAQAAYVAGAGVPPQINGGAPAAHLDQHQILMQEKQFQEAMRIQMAMK